MVEIMKKYGLIGMSINELTESYLDAEKNSYDFSPDYVLKTEKKEDVAKFFIQNRRADRDRYCVEMWEEDEDGEFIEGGDADTIENFLKNIDKR